MDNIVHQTVTTLMMALQTQMLRGIEKFDWDDEDFCEAGHDVLVLLVTLQHEVSYDFSEQVRQAILRPCITEAVAELQQICCEYTGLPA